MKKIIISIIAMTSFMGPLFAGAHTKGMFTITVDNEGLYGSAADALVATIDSAIKKETFTKTLGYMADSQNMATRGLGVTYATNHSLFILSGSFNVGASPGPRTIPEFAANPLGTGVPEMGLGVQGSILLGLTLKAFHLKPIGFFDPSRLTVFANFLSFGLKTPTFGAKTTSFGIHLQYKIIDEANLLLGLIHWGGVDVTTGFDFANNALSLPMKQFFTTQSSGGLTFTPTGDLSFINTAATIPIEVSTNIRIAYLLTLILGGAVDINMGNAKLDLGKAEITENTFGTRVGDLTVNESGRVGASFADFRLFFGPQINIIPLPSGKNILSLTLLGSLSTNNIYGFHLSLNAGF